VALIGKKEEWIKVPSNNHDPTAKDKSNLVEEILDWEFTSSL
jgi:hypothetical protein